MRQRVGRKVAGEKPNNWASMSYWRKTSLKSDTKSVEGIRESRDWLGERELIIELELNPGGGEG